jgi:putative hydrolase of the HAD superfamily
VELPHVNIRAVIFDIYGTLLEVSPPSEDAPARWEQLWRDSFATSPRLALAHFSAACDDIVTREHAHARARGIPFPEVCWPAVAAEPLPELRAFSVVERGRFLFQQAQLWHTVRMAAETAATLRWLKDRASLLGIASNAQAYTLRELEQALATHALGMDLFESHLCFWSFEHGFSKPDPHVFQILTARLAALGVSPREILMVGDRLDNDIEPAKVHGWRTWQLGLAGDGDWAGLRRTLRGLQPKASP